MRRSRWPAIVLVALTLLQSGCWDRSEIEDQFYVVTLGVDRGDHPGEYMVTALVALVQLFSSGTLESPVKPATPALGVTKLTARARSITQAVHILNAGTTRRLDLRHLRAVVLGEGLAREGVEGAVMELTRNPLARGANLLLQARGSAYDLLTHLAPVGEMNASRMVEGYMMQAKQLHLAPPSRLHHFLQRLAARGGDAYLPVLAINEAVIGGDGHPAPMPTTSALPGEVPRGGGNPVEMVGTAIYRSDRLTGFLTIDETQMFLAMRGEMGKSYITIADPIVSGQAVALRFHQENLPQWRAELSGQRPHVSGKILFEGEVLAIPSAVDYWQPEPRRRLEDAAARYAETIMKRLLGKFHEWGADPMGFGNRYRFKFASWQAWSDWNWPARIADLEVEVQVEMRIRRYGLISGREILTRKR